MVAPLGPDDRVIFGQSMEGLWRALQPCTPAEQAAFVEAGVDGSDWQPAYPVADYMRIVEAAVTGRFGSLPRIDGYAQLGRLFFTSYENTLLGKTLVPLLRVLGPQRCIGRLTRIFRSANNFTQAEVEEVSPTRCLVRLRTVTNPGFFKGIVEAAGPHTGAKNVTVTLVSTSDDQLNTFEISWA